MQIILLSLSSVAALITEARCADVAMASSTEFIEKPFWRVKPPLLKKIIDNRDIIVSVSTLERVEKKSGLHTLLMRGGGMVKKESTLVFAEVLKYENLKKVSERIVEVQFSSEKNELYVHCEAFNYHARMWMSVTPLHEKGENSDPKLKFKVLRGNFVGMEGEFIFENYKPGITLMGFNATFDYKTLPMPRFFVEFGLEIVLQKVARDMRAFLEKSPSL